MRRECETALCPQNLAQTPHLFKEGTELAIRDSVLMSPSGGNIADKALWGGARG